jgi:N-ethylmaleimide reductase
VEGWKRVTDAVHKNDGRIFLQIWHGGRQGHPDILNGQNPVGPSPIAVRGKCRTFKGLADYPVPEELSEGGINEILDQFRIGAENALKAGFDGIQLHGSNGYIVDQFFRDCSNKRSDKYGGNVRNRARFALEVIDILINVFGKDKVGIKLSPVSRYGDMFDSNPIENYSYLVNELDKKGIMFIEFVEPPEFVTVTDHYGIKGENQIPNVCKVFRPLFRNLIIGNNNFTFETGNQKVEYKDADMISYGKLFISNPDLVERFRNNWELTKPELRYFYSGTEKGYSDYPRYSPAHKL